MKERLKALIPEDDNLYELASDKWFVSYDGAGQDLAEKAGIRGGEDHIGTGIVLAVTTYSGRASPTLWDWIRRHEL